MVATTRSVLGSIRSTVPSSWFATQTEPAPTASPHGSSPPPTIARILPVAAASGPDDYLTVDDRDVLERAFRRLTGEQRAVLVFHHYPGLSMAEVAVRLGIPDGTAKPRLHHASRALRAGTQLRVTDAAVWTWLETGGNSEPSAK